MSIVSQILPLGNGSIVHVDRMFSARVRITDFTVHVLQIRNLTNVRVSQPFTTPQQLVHNFIMQCLFEMVALTHRHVQLSYSEHTLKQECHK